MGGTQDMEEKLNGIACRDNARHSSTIDGSSDKKYYPARRLFSYMPVNFIFKSLLASA
jgi:hypothetical protein